MLYDELLHQSLTFGIFEIDNFDAARAKRLLAADEGVVLAPESMHVSTLTLRIKPRDSKLT